MIVSTSSLITDPTEPINQLRICKDSLTKNYSVIGEALVVLSRVHNNVCIATYVLLQLYCTKSIFVVATIQLHSSIICGHSGMRFLEWYWYSCAWMIKLVIVLWDGWVLLSCVHACNHIHFQIWLSPCMYKIYCTTLQSMTSA